MSREEDDSPKAPPANLGSWEKVRRRLDAAKSVRSEGVGDVTIHTAGGGKVIRHADGTTTYVGSSQSGNGTETKQAPSGIGLSREDPERNTKYPRKRGKKKK